MDARKQNFGPWPVGWARPLGEAATPLVGPSWFYGTGTYFAATGEQYDAAILHTWDADYWELIIMMDPQILVHANQHTNGFPLADTYTAN